MTMTISMKLFKQRNRAIYAALTLLSICFTTQSHALKSDRNQPAEIEADNTEIDFKSGVRTLTNNVLVVQGTLRLKADKLVAIYNKSGDLSKATAWGSLARFKQRPDDKPDDVEGWGKKMVVDYTDNTLTLIGSAALKQGETTARGETIIYNMETDKLQILGNSNVKTAGKNTTPKRTIKDPFSEDSQGPANTIPSNIEQTQQFNNQDSPAPAGRSRLIIQPKALKKD